MENNELMPNGQFDDLVRRLSNMPMLILREIFKLALSSKAEDIRSRCPDVSSAEEKELENCLEIIALLEEQSKD